MLTALLKSAIKRSATSLARDPGLGACLMYHRIFEPTAGAAPNGAARFAPNESLYVPLKSFDAHLRYLSENYRCLPLGEVVGRLRSGTLEPGSIAITFDDGFRDIFDLALPVLKKYQVPATVYFTTGLITGESPLFWWDELERVIAKAASVSWQENGRIQTLDTSTIAHKRHAFLQLGRRLGRLAPPAQERLLRELCQSAGVERGAKNEGGLSWEELRKLDAEPLITVGAHSISHPVLRHLDDRALEAEILGSKRLLEEKLGHPVEHFAYPFGDREHASEREFRCVERAGFASAVTTRLGNLRPFHGKHRFSIPRVPIDGRVDIEALKWKLSGIESLLKRPLSRFRPDLR